MTFSGYVHGRGERKPVDLSDVHFCERDFADWNACPEVASQGDCQCSAHWKLWSKAAQILNHCRLMTHLSHSSLKALVLDAMYSASLLMSQICACSAAMQPTGSSACRDRYVDSTLAIERLCVRAPFFDAEYHVTEP